MQPEHVAAAVRQYTVSGFNSILKAFYYLVLTESESDSSWGSETRHGRTNQLQVSSYGSNSESTPAMQLASDLNTTVFQVVQPPGPANETQARRSQVGIRVMECHEPESRSDHDDSGGPYPSHGASYAESHHGPSRRRPGGLGTRQEAHWQPAAQSGGDARRHWQRGPPRLKIPNLQDRAPSHAT